MSIVILIAIGIGLPLILAFFAVNGWSSFARDRQASAALRANRQMDQPTREERGTGINRNAGMHRIRRAYSQRFPP